MREKIKNAAKELTVPERLKPDNIEKLLAEEQRSSGRGKRGRKMQRLYAGYLAAAAVFALVCGTFAFTGVQQNVIQQKKNDEHVTESQKNAETQSSVEVQNRAETQNSVDGEKNEGINSGKLSEEMIPSVDKSEPQEIVRADAGDLYHVASDYEQVYDAIVQTYGGYWYVKNMPIEEAAEREIIEYSSMSDGVLNDAIADTEQKFVATESSYSKTNVQTEGVDESDIVKTDGSYLYIVDQNQITILDIREGAPKKLTSLHPGAKSASTAIQEIYVDDSKLVVILQAQETTLAEETGQNGNAEQKPIGQSSANAISCYYTVSRQTTTMYTYSLKNPAMPELLGEVSVDGAYYTSRKIGDKVYLFTEENVGQRCYEYAADSEGWIPLAGGTQIAADCIYIPEQGHRSLIAASADLDTPDKLLDSVMIVNNSVNVYVSTEAIYLYHTDWIEAPMTQIAKFTLEDGIINAQGATSVKGRVQDTFAVNESGGRLRILTCDDSSGTGSSLYILDEDLSLMGSLEGIAPGETVYAARFMGDMAYFVTYRNIDPLFAADLSDPENPVILGELKITGYSEYLHMWTEGKLLGIGYETDPDTGNREGVKLSMFDASDPAQLTVSDSICITDADYSPAMDQYKTVLADSRKNLIGFVVTEYNRYRENTYLLYQWENGEFDNLLAVDLSENANNTRGVYAGEYFYIVDADRVQAFHMTEEYEKVGEAALE